MGGTDKRKRIQRDGEEGMLYLPYSRRVSEVKKNNIKARATVYCGRAVERGRRDR